jgi:hypothetical protein
MSWLFDTRAAITCMNSRSFNATFGSQKLKKISKSQRCVAASGNAMSSVGVYELDLWIKGQKFTHPVNVIMELNDNIIRIDFMHLNTRQMKFADSQMNTIYATKQIIIPAMTSSIVSAKFQGETHKEKTYIAAIYCLGNPTITGVLAIFSINDNSNCQLMVENCAPCEVIIDRNDLMGLVEIEEGELIPLTDDTAAKICASIEENIPKYPRTNLSRDEIA